MTLKWDVNNNMTGHCRNICEQLPFVINGRAPWKTFYGMGLNNTGLNSNLKRCTTCAYYADGTNLESGFRCPCCKYKLRTSPHTRTKTLKITTREVKRI